MPRSLIAAVALTVAVLGTPAPNTMTQPEPMVPPQQNADVAPSAPRETGAPQPAEASTPVAEAMQIPAAVTDDLAAFGTSQGWGDPASTRAWITDLDGDGADDVLAQAAYQTGQGNAPVLYHFPYFAEGKGFRRGSAMTLSDGIKSVGRSGRGLIVTVHKYSDGDSPCCPTGEDVLNLSF